MPPRMHELCVCSAFQHAARHSAMSSCGRYAGEASNLIAIEHQGSPSVAALLTRVANERIAPVDQGAVRALPFAGAQPHPRRVRRAAALRPQPRSERGEACSESSDPESEIRTLRLATNGRFHRQLLHVEGADLLAVPCWPIGQLGREPAARGAGVADLGPSARLTVVRRKIVARHVVDGAKAAVPAHEGGE